MKKRSRIIPVLCTLLVATFLFGTVSATNISMIGNTVTEPPLTQEELEHISECNALIEQQLARDNLTRAIYNNYLSMSVITQENGYYCGPATACMVAKTLGRINDRQQAQTLTAQIRKGQNFHEKKISHHSRFMHTFGRHLFVWNCIRNEHQYDWQYSY